MGAPITNQDAMRDVQSLDCSIRPTFRTTVVDPTFAELVADQPRHLDTVFHAARADALLPLRNTIAWLRAGSPNNETKPHRPTSYQGVHVTGVDASMQGATVTVFSPSLKQLYERSKEQKGEFAADRVFRNRIKPGNLVAVSFDNFASHEKVYIGTIAPTDFGTCAEEPLPSCLPRPGSTRSHPQTSRSCSRQPSRSWSRPCTGRPPATPSGRSNSSENARSRCSRSFVEYPNEEPCSNYPGSRSTSINVPSPSS
jgi:hypothetical protein